MILRRTFLSLFAGVFLAGGVACAQSAAPKRQPDVHWEPSSDAAIKAMMEMAGVKKGDIVYDLGCGDGRVVITAVREYGARGVGIDIDPQRIAESNANAKKAGLANMATFREDDLFTAKIGDASVVTLFLWPALNLKLRPKLLRDLKPGTRIVSNMHDMGDWAPNQTRRVEGRNVYLWIIPDKIPPGM